MMKNREERLPGYLVIGSLLILLVLAVVTGLFFSLSALFSALAGGGVAIVNLLWQRRALGALLQLTPLDRPMLSALVRFVIRISLTAVVLYLIVISPWFSIWGLLAGLSTTVICLFGLALYVAIPSKETSP
jgi:hypothetical protein